MKKISILILVVIFSCSHSSNNIKNRSVIEKEFELGIKEKNKNKKSLIVYASFDIAQHKAELNGVSSFNTQVFHLEICKDRYLLVEKQNNRKTRGLLSSFQLIPLSEDLVFEELPYLKNNKIIRDKRGTIFSISPINSFY